MITTPTILVLGAGASCPYGFPTARELKWQICDAFENVNKTAALFLGHKSDYMPSEFVDFAHALTHSGQHSVDQFLEHRAKEFMEIGKLAIAYCLIRYEDERKLFRPKLDYGGGDWYEYLFESLTLLSQNSHKTSCRSSRLTMIDLSNTIC